MRCSEITAAFPCRFDFSHCISLFSVGPLRQGGCLLIKFGRSARKILDKPHPVWYYSRASSRCFYKYALVAQLDRVFGYEPKGRGFESLRAHQAGAKFALLRLIFLSATENKPSARSLAPPFRKKSRSAHLFGCKRPHDGSLSLTTFCEFERVQLPPPKCRKYLFHVAFTSRCKLHIACSDFSFKKSPARSRRFGLLPTFFGGSRVRIRLLKTLKHLFPVPLTSGSLLKYW